jgi:hypothetical protein
MVSVECERPLGAKKQKSMAGPDEILADPTR